MRQKWILFLLPLWLLATTAQAEYFTIKKYHVNVTFTEEGYADFEEVIDVEFSEPRHGIFRWVPYRSVVNDRRVDRIIKDIDVKGYNFSTSRENQNIVIKIGDADTYVEGHQTYRVHYRVLNPFNFFEDHIEFYWDLLGISWTVDVEQFTFKLNFPEQVSLTENDVYAYSGLTGEKNLDVEIQLTPRELSGRSTRPFAPGEGFTIAVRFDKGVFAPLSGWSVFLAQHSLLLAVPVFLLAGLFALYFARNRRQTIMTEYFPPEGISPAVAGGFVDHSVDNNDVLSLIPHLANKGYMRLEVKEGTGFFKKDEITFYKLKEAGSELFEFEKSFFNALFATGSVVELDDLKDKFHSHMTGVKSSVKGWIMLQGWYEADQKKMGCIIAIAGFIALGWGALAVFVRQNLDGFALIGTGLLMFYFASKFNKRSPE